MKNKYEKAELLLDGIGEIDERLIFEAQFWRPQRSSFKKPLLVAASLIVAFTLIFGSMSDLLFGDFTAPSTEQTLDSLLVDSRDKNTYTTCSRDEISYLDGNAYVVWQYSDSEEYCVSDRLSKTELTAIKRELGHGTEVGNSSPSLDCKVWLIMGDGSVVSPYLKLDSGNVGSEVFDYEAEIYPTDDLISCISGIIE